MRKALLIVCAVVCSVFYASAQQYEDVVYLKNGSIVRGVILEQVPGTSLKIQTIGGSQFVYSIADVEKITKEIPAKNNRLNIVSKEKDAKVKHSIDWNIEYKGEVNVGYAISGKSFNFDSYYSDSDGENDVENAGKWQTVFSRPLIETVHGVEIGPYLFVGAGLGVQYYCGKLQDFRDYAELAAEIKEKNDISERWNAVMLPIFADVKLMYPVKNGFTPFLNLGLGGTVGCYSSINCKYSEDDFTEAIRTRGGIYCDFGAGFRYKLLNVSVGLQHQAFKIEYKAAEYYDGESWSEKGGLSTMINSFYVKVGVNF